MFSIRCIPTALVLCAITFVCAALIFSPRSGFDEPRESPLVGSRDGIDGLEMPLERPPTTQATPVHGIRVASDEFIDGILNERDWESDPALSTRATEYKTRLLAGSHRTVKARYDFGHNLQVDVAVGDTVLVTAWIEWRIWDSLPVPTY